MQCKYGQFLEIQPSNGNKRKIKLNRTCFEINFIKKGDFFRKEKFNSNSMYQFQSKIQLFWSHNYFEVRSEDRLPFG